jgi:ketosteroid isomerase-like protein
MSCSQKVKSVEENKPTDMSVLESEITSRLRQYEDYLQKGDSIALSNMYTEDAEILPSVAGRENIKKIFTAMIRDSVIGNFETIHLWGNDALIIEEGKGVWSNKSGQTESKGKYLLVWKKEEGEWKILRDTWFPEK